jgi:putative RNA 2'-phosphotransferase
MTENDFRIRLSKFLSFILRHDPSKYNLKLDKNGYAQVKDVLSVLKDRFSQFKEAELFSVIESDSKGRFELKDDKIRATYGHSIDVECPKENIIPPKVLYHGTSEGSAEVILREGLKPMQRRYVHLSESEEDARAVGLRHTFQPVILEIRAKEAHDQGLEFFKEKRVYLTKEIPASFIEKRGV